MEAAAAIAGMIFGSIVTWLAIRWLNDRRVRKQISKTPNQFRN
jgi:hypothetical protein